MGHRPCQFHHQGNSGFEAFRPRDLSQAWNVIIEALAQAEPQRRRMFEQAVYVQHIGLMGVTTQSKTTVVNTTLPEHIPAEDPIFQHRNGR